MPIATIIIGFKVILPAITPTDEPNNDNILKIFNCFLLCLNIY